MLYLSAIILSFFLSFVLITKRSKTRADYILVAWLSVTGFHLLCYYIIFTSQVLNYPTLTALGITLPLAHGPFLYLYTKHQTSSTLLPKKHLLHFLPVLLSGLMFGEFYFMSLDQKIEVFRGNGQLFKTQSIINMYAVYASGVIYIFLSLNRLLKYRKRLVQQFSNTEKINFNWLLYLIIWMMIIWIAVLFVREDKIIYGAASLFILWLGYFGIKQVRVFSQNSYGIEGESDYSVNRNDNADGLIGSECIPKSDSPLENNSSDNLKYQKSTLSEQDAAAIHERLINLMAEQKPYKNPDLTLNELAKTLEVHPNHLSQVINSKEKKSFYDLINEMRVEEFIKLSAHPSSMQYTLLAISYDCGFNSKASFNRNFKKHTGFTPSDYIKQQPMA